MDQDGILSTLPGCPAYLYRPLCRAENSQTRPHSGRLRQLSAGRSLLTSALFWTAKNLCSLYPYAVCAVRLWDRGSWIWTNAFAPCFGLPGKRVSRRAILQEPRLMCACFGCRNGLCRLPLRPEIGFGVCFRTQVRG